MKYLTIIVRKFNMKKLPLLLSIVAIIIGGVSFYYSKSSSELVYVDVNKLIQGYTRSKEAKVELEKKANVMKANLDSLESSWQNDIKNYERERASTPPNELTLKQQVMANKQQQITDYQNAVRTQMQQEDQKITQTVINDINDYVKDYGKKHGYKLIFGASGGGNIMYADESTDLTEEILKGLNSQYVKK